MDSRPTGPIDPDGVDSELIGAEDDASDDDAPLTDPELESALRFGRASFAQWASAWFFSRQRFNPSARSRARWAKYRDGGLFQAFVAAEGYVADSYYCDGVPSAAAMTLRRRSVWSKVFRWEEPSLHIMNNSPPGSDGDPDAVAAIELISTCERLAVRAQDFLPIQQRTQCVGMIYGLTTDALFILDEAARRLGAKATETPSQEAGESGLVADARQRATYIASYLDSLAKRAAQFYFLRGVIASAVVVMLIGWLLHGISSSGLIGAYAAWSLVAGGFGAVASVLVRVRSSGLTIDYEVGRTRLVILGAIRPVIGAASGILLYLAVVAGIIPLAHASGRNEQQALFAVTAFFAGFNERWIQDMLANVGTRLRLAGSEETSAADEPEATDAGGPTGE